MDSRRAGDARTGATSSGTALHRTRIALVAKNRQRKCQNRQRNNPWRPAAKQNPLRIEPVAMDYFLGGLTAKQSRAASKLQLRQEIITTAKDTTFLSGRRQPRIQLFLAVINSQEYNFPWRSLTAKENIFLDRPQRFLGCQPPRKCIKLIKK